MARISEMHYSNAYARVSGVDEFLEIALSPQEDPADFTASFYDRDGTLNLAVPLDDAGVQVSYDADADEYVYVISAAVYPIALTDPDGGGAGNSEAFALTHDPSGTVIDFYDIGGGTTEIRAVEGPAAGARSENVPAPYGPDQTRTSIQFNKPDPEQLVHAAVDPGSSGFICFSQQTRIAVPGGRRAAGRLAPGDMVLTRDRGAQPLRWVGRRTLRALGTDAPVVFAPGAIGNDAELVLSPLHRVLLRGARAELMFGTREVLVPARALLNDSTIRRRPGGVITYVHLLFDRHEILLAEGAEAESLHPGGVALGRLSQGARAEVLGLFPELIHDPDSYGPTARPSLTGGEARVLTSLAI